MERVNSKREKNKRYWIVVDSEVWSWIVNHDVDNLQ